MKVVRQFAVLRWVMYRITLWLSAVAWQPAKSLKLFVEDTCSNISIVFAVVNAAASKVKSVAEKEWYMRIWVSLNVSRVF